MIGATDHRKRAMPSPLDGLLLCLGGMPNCASSGATAAARVNVASALMMLARVRLRMGRRWAERERKARYLVRIWTTCAAAAAEFYREEAAAPCNRFTCLNTYQPYRSTYPPDKSLTSPAVANVGVEQGVVTTMGKRRARTALCTCLMVVGSSRAYAFAPSILHVSGSFLVG